MVIPVNAKYIDMADKIFGDYNVLGSILKVRIRTISVS
jgi:hypothetical protein